MCEVSGLGSNRLCPSFRRRSSASAGRRRGSQSPVQTCAAGAHPPLFGRPLAGSGVARRAGVSRPAVWRWQARYAEPGVDSLLRDKTQKPGRAPLSARVIANVMGPDLLRAAGPRHALDRPRHRRSRRRQPARRSALVVGSIGCSRIAFAPSSAPTILSLPRRSRTSSASTWTLPSPRWSSRSTRRAKSRRSPHATGPAAQARKCGTMTHDYKRKARPLSPRSTSSTEP
jgi:hypothetical protein